MSRRLPDPWPLLLQATFLPRGCRASGLSRVSAALVPSLPCIDPSAPVLSQALRQEQRPSAASQPAFLRRLHHPTHPVLEMPLFLVPLFSNFIQSWKAEKSSIRRQPTFPLGSSGLARSRPQVSVRPRPVSQPRLCWEEALQWSQAGGRRRGWLSGTFSLSEACLWPPPFPNFLVCS